METIEQMRRRIRSAEELQSIVKTMKAMASASIWQYERAVESLLEYRRTIEQGLQIALQRHAAGIDFTEDPVRNRLGAVVLGSDQGMVGRFNDVIVEFALERMNAMQVKQEERSLIVLGRRARNKLQDRNQPVDAFFEMPGSIPGIRRTMQAVMAELPEWWPQHNVDHIVVFHNVTLSGAAYEPHETHLLPLDLAWLNDLKQRPWHSRSLPTYDLEWQELFATLIREYFFMAIFRAFAESLAAENASRLASMQSAERNIEEKLDDLNNRYHQLRQSSITAELLDIVSGAEAAGE